MSQMASDESLQRLESISAAKKNFVSVARRSSSPGPPEVARIQSCCVKNEDSTG